MKRYLGLLLALALLPLVWASDSNVYSQKRDLSRPLYVEGQILVKFKAEAGPIFDGKQAADMVLPEVNLEAQPLTPNLLDQAGGDNRLFVIQLADGVSVEEAIARVSADPRVEYAEPNYLMYATRTPDDTMFAQQWGLLNDGLSGKAGADIGASGAWDMTTGDDNIVVAVLDTGADLSHPDLAPNAWKNPGEVAGNGLDDDNNGLIDDISGWNFRNNNNQFYQSPGSDDHGTHVAGIIGAAGDNNMGVAGVAWNVKLISLKFIDGRNGGSTSDAVKAINYLIDLKKRGVNVKIINASWGGPAAPTSLRNAIRDAGNAGILFVTASGNSPSGVGFDIDEEADYPSSWSTEVPTIISVASLDRQDNKANSSNFGHKTVSVGAPGVRILSTYPGGQYVEFSGTSMATPHVAGIAVLLWSVNPSLTPVQVKERIIRTAEPVAALASRAISSGRASAANALANITPAPSRIAIGHVRANKKTIYVDGIGFVKDSSIIEINGVPVSKNKYDSDYTLADGSPTRIFSKLGKSTMNQLVPRQTRVRITVFDPTLNVRTDGFDYIRP